MSRNRLMSEADERVATYLQKQLDDRSTSYEDKLEIIQWFDSFDYLTGEETLIDHLLRHADNLQF